MLTAVDFHLVTTISGHIKALTTITFTEQRDKHFLIINKELAQIKEIE